MRAADLIQKKRDGGSLEAAELAELVEGYLARSVPDYQMAAFLMAVYFRGMTDAETAALTDCLLQSGERVDLSGVNGPTVDKHSTGGVGDKTSLVLVPLVAAAGVRVAKMSGAALGHTGGTLDKLAVFDGIRTAADPSEIARLVGSVGCALVGTSEHIAPADKALYALRDVTATVDSIPLIAASVMSKKLAIANDALVLDVKVGTGAFMHTVEQGRALARTMVALARRHGRQVRAFVTRMDQPLGRAVGNALEVEEALRTLRGEGPEDLTELVLALGSEMVRMGGAAESAAEARVNLARCMQDGSAIDRFAALVAAQGGDPASVHEPERLPAAPVQQDLLAPRDGWMQAWDAYAVGSTAMALGAGRRKQADAIDLRVGIVLHRKVGEMVHAGERLASVHACDEASARMGVRRLEAAFRLSAEATAALPLVVDTID